MVNAAKMREELNRFDDFKNEVTIYLYNTLKISDISACLYKFHCKLNAIVQCWCHVIKHTRAYANSSIMRVRTTVPEGLNTRINQQVFHHVQGLPEEVQIISKRF